MLCKKREIFTNKCLLEDSFGRHFPYLRLSLTEVCNFKCVYCLPRGYTGSYTENFLNVSEITNLIAAFATLGLQKVRLTGGEPTLRHDFFDIVKAVKMFRSVKEMVFTTNGYTLEYIAQRCVLYGITGVNVSVDSLKEDVFSKVTGRTNCFKRVIRGIDCAISVGLKTKINVVLLNYFCREDFDFFLDFIRNRFVSVRFIELVGTNNTLHFFKKNYVSSLFIKNYLLSLGWVKVKKSTTDGPAVEYTHKKYVGTIGFISSYSSDFCLSCNRLRVSAKGEIYLCLFGSVEKVFTFRYLLKSSTQKKLLLRFIREKIFQKDLTHSLLDGQLGRVKQLSDIGG